MLMMNHENICNILDIFRLHQETVISLPLMKGSLWDLVYRSRGGRLDENLARHCMRQVLEALAYMHDLGIAHRDIKDPNILDRIYDGILTVKVADFGAARALPKGQNKFDCRQEYTTYSYASPEQVRKQPYGLKSDVHRLYALLWYRSQ